MAVVLVAINLTLIPRWGLLGAASAGAVVTIVSNLWYLSEVRKSLGIRPSLRKYFALILPATVMIASLLLFRGFVIANWPAWGAVVASLSLAYVIFVGVSLLVALDLDDRDIARAVWSKILQMTSARATGGA